MLKKMLKILKNPKILYYHYGHYLRYLLECFKIDTLSKPYGIENLDHHKKLLKYFSYQDGFFIEIGGFDGYFHSPTYYLEKFLKWKGVLVEPDPFHFKKCKYNRKKTTVMNSACVSFQYPEKTVTISCLSHSTHIKGTADNKNGWIEKMQEQIPTERREATVPAQTLTAILHEHFKENSKRTIDLFVLDVEEYELEVLKGLDFSQYAPSFLLVESHTNARQQQVESFLSPKGYQMIEKISHQDYLYKKHENPI